MVPMKIGGICIDFTDNKIVVTDGRSDGRTHPHIEMRKHI